MKKTNENGRSMVEMLGVLAIIGVLSIGGIAGYTLAMNKYRANEIVNAVVQAAVECRTRGQISSDVYTDIQGLGTPSCVKQSIGLVSFTVAYEDVAKAVVKTINVYSEANLSSSAGTVGVVENSKVTSSSNSSALTGTLYYQPVS